MGTQSLPDLEAPWKAWAERYSWNPGAWDAVSGSQQLWEPGVLTTQFSECFLFLLMAGLAPMWQLNEMATAVGVGGGYRGRNSVSFVMVFPDLAHRLCLRALVEECRREEVVCTVIGKGRA